MRWAVMALLALTGCVSHVYDQPGTFTTKNLAGLDVAPKGEVVTKQDCGRVVLIIPAGSGSAQEVLEEIEDEASADTFVNVTQAEEDLVVVAPFYYQRCVRIQAQPVDGGEVFATLMGGGAAAPDDAEEADDSAQTPSEPAADEPTE